MFGSQKMQNQLISQAYEELFQDLVKAKAWFESLRLPTHENRFATIFNNVNNILQHYDKATLDDVLRNHPMPELLISLLDAGDFVTIHQEFRKLKSS